jgi:hypothetical protein
MLKLMIPILLGFIVYFFIKTRKGMFAINTIHNKTKLREKNEIQVEIQKKLNKNLSKNKKT